LYVSAELAKAIDVVDPQTGRVLGEAPTGADESHMLDGKSVFTHDQGAPRIAVIDTATNKLARWIELPASVYSSTPTPDGKFLVANAPSGKAFVIDLSSEKVIGSYPIPEAIGEIAVDASGTFAFISCPAKGTIEVLNLRAAKLEEPIVMTPGVDGLEWFAGIS
jgi:DNA-binding beta-propeller fold protein YncE